MIVGEAKDDYIIGCMPIAWRITKATNTHSEYVILIAFPRQPYLHERHQCYFIPTLPLRPRFIRVYCLLVLSYTPNIING